MNRNARIFCFLILTLAALIGCSSKPSAQDSKKAETALDKIQGKAQVLTESGGASDAALNAGGPSVYLWVGARRYRLFLRTPVELVHGDQYVAEGVYAQKAIDEIGDPDQGKNGYPLESSCDRVVKTTWPGLAFDVTDGYTTSGAASAEPKKEAAAEEKTIKEVSVAADKQKALLMEGSPVQTAPLWEPEGGTVSCKVVIDPEGKISDLESTTQLCESVTWSQFRYQPPVQGGHPVKVKTEVEMRFEPRK